MAPLLVRTPPRPTIALAAAGLGACAPAIDAPDNAEAQAVFAFVHFQDEGHVEAVVDSLLDFGAADDPTLDEGFLVDQLGNDDLAAVGVPDPDVDGVIGALGRARYRIATSQVADGVSHPDRADFLESVDRFDVLDENGDRACFVRGECEAYTFQAIEATPVPLLGLTTRTFTTELRWIDSMDHGRVLALRSIAPDPVEVAVPLLAVDQQHSFALIGPTDAGALRVEAFWVDARVLGVELPEGYAVRQAVSRMQTSADALNDHFEGEEPPS